MITFSETEDHERTNISEGFSISNVHSLKYHQTFETSCFKDHSCMFKFYAKIYVILLPHVV